MSRPRAAQLEPAGSSAFGVLGTMCRRTKHTYRSRAVRPSPGGRCINASRAAALIRPAPVPGSRRWEPCLRPAPRRCCTGRSRRHLRRCCGSLRLRDGGSAAPGTSGSTRQCAWRTWHVSLATTPWTRNRIPVAPCKHNARNPSRRCDQRHNHCKKNGRPLQKGRRRRLKGRRLW